MATMLKHLKLGSLVVLQSDLSSAQTALEGQINALASQISNNLTNYYQKSQTYNKTEVDNMVSAIPKFKVRVASAVSAQNPEPDVANPEVNTVYLVPASNASGTDAKNVYREWIYIKGTTYTAINVGGGETGDPEVGDAISGTVYEYVNGVYAVTTDDKYVEGKTYYSGTEAASGTWETLGTQDLNLTGYVRFDQVLKTASFNGSDDVNPVTAKAVADAIAAHVANITQGDAITLTTEADGKTKKINVKYNSTRLKINTSDELDLDLDATLSDTSSAKAAQAGAVVSALALKANKLNTLTDETELSDILTTLGATLPSDEPEEEEPGSGTGTGA